MASHWFFRYYFGKMLPAICEAWNLSPGACEPLHNAFKEAFDIDSTTYFDDTDFIVYLDSLHALLVAEFATLVPHVNEPSDVAEMTMRQFLNLYKNMK